MCYARMDTVRVVPGLHGLEHRTLRCPKCRLIYEARASAGWSRQLPLRWIFCHTESHEEINKGDTEKEPSAAIAVRQQPVAILTSRRECHLV